MLQSGKDPGQRMGKARTFLFSFEFLIPSLLCQFTTVVFEHPEGSHFVALTYRSYHVEKVLVTLTLESHWYLFWNLCVNFNYIGEQFGKKYGIIKEAVEVTGKFDLESNEKTDTTQNRPEDIVYLILLQLLNQESENTVVDLQGLGFKLFQMDRDPD